MEIPTIPKAPSVRSFFDALSSSRRSFMGGLSKVAQANYGSGAPQDDDTHEINPAIADAIPVDAPTLLEEQSMVIAKVVACVNSLIVEDLEADRSCFIGSAIPPITLGDYVERLVRYCNQWGEDVAGPTSTGVRCMMIAVEYLSRSKVRLTPRSIHRFMMTAMLLAIKFTEDFAISNKFWGDVGGCKLEDVNRMEATFCIQLNWDFRLSTDAFVAQQARFARPSF